MSKLSAEDLILNALYNLEKNYGELPTHLIIPTAIKQLKHALKEMTPEYNEMLKVLGLKELT